MRELAGWWVFGSLLVPVILIAGGRPVGGAALAAAALLGLGGVTCSVLRVFGGTACSRRSGSRKRRGVS